MIDDECGDKIYAVMELLEGGPLLSWDSVSKRYRRRAGLHAPPGMATTNTSGTYTASGQSNEFGHVTMHTGGSTGSNGQRASTNPFETDTSSGSVTHRLAQSAGPVSAETRATDPMTGLYSELEVRRVAHDVIDALWYLHSVGICSRDIKPENILLTAPRMEEVPHAEPWAKVIDLGIAKVLLSDAPYSDYTTGMEGTPAFLPPECYRPNYGRFGSKAAIPPVGRSPPQVPPMLGRTNRKCGQGQGQEQGQVVSPPSMPGGSARVPPFLSRGGKPGLVVSEPS